MRALVDREEGRIEVDLIEEPDPGPGDSEAVVEVAAVNRGELRLPADRPRGLRPGQDVAGTVVLAAVNDTDPTMGARVGAWPEQAGWAEKVAVPTLHLAPLAPTVTSSRATQPIAGVTALRAHRLGGNRVSPSR